MISRRSMMMFPLAGVVLTSSTVRAAGTAVAFSQEGYEQALASGEPFLLDFKAQW